MVGLIFVALFVYKQCSITSQKSSKTNFLKVEDTISIGPRKQVFVLRAGYEKFLVASDADRTTLLAKLEQSVEKIEPQIVDEIPRTHHFEDCGNSKSAIKKFAKKLDL
jgi:flagellar biogenesis protein FliO